MTETNVGSSVEYRSSTWVVDSQHPDGQAVHSHRESPGTAAPTISQTASMTRPVSDNWYQAFGQSAQPTVSGDQLSTTQSNALGRLDQALKPVLEFLQQNGGNAAYTSVAIFTGDGLYSGQNGSESDGGGQANAFSGGDSAADDANDGNHV